MKGVICQIQIFFFLFSGISLFSQPAEISFEHISVEQGLSQGYVTSLFRDSEGFIWIGTQDGLNRFDAYEFRTYYHNPENPNGLTNNYIWCLVEDSRGAIWVGTFGGGLCRYDRAIEEFRSFNPNPLSQASVAEYSIRSLLEYPQGTLWVGTDRGLFKMDLETLEFQPDSLLNLTSIPRPFELVTAIEPIGENSILADASHRTLIIDPKNKSIKEIEIRPEASIQFSDLAPYSPDHYWMGTNAGLFKIKFLEARDSFAVLDHFKFEQNAPNTLPSNQISTLHLDDKGILWIGTTEGLSYMDTSRPDRGFRNFMNDPNNPNSLSNNLIYSLLELEPGLMWVGTREGINQFKTRRPVFQNIRFREDGKGLCSNTILGMEQDGRGDLWVGTKGGLSLIRNFTQSAENWEFQCFQPGKKSGMLYDYVINVSSSEEEKLWVSFRRNGFARIIPGSEKRPKWEYYNYLTDNLKGSGMNTIFEDEEGTVWLGTQGFGLWKWEPDLGNLKIFKSDETQSSLAHDYIFSIAGDHLGRLWVGTANGGLCRMNKTDGTFSCFTHSRQDPGSLSNNRVLSIFEDHQNRLWVCTANGLNLMEEDGHFHRFWQKDGLPNNVIYGMLEDDSDNLWISTNKGISRLTYADGDLEVQNFDTEDGLPGNEFNQYAFLKTRDGRLCFGGVNGLAVFDPKDIKPSPLLPKVVLTDFQLFNESVPVGAGEKREFFLPNAINRTEKIELSHKQNFIAFQFAALGFTNPGGNQYAYKMESLNEDWVFCGARRYAGFPNLAPGKYTFSVKASNSDGVWNESPKSIEIEIFQPPWKTWWAYLIYLFIVMAAVYGIIWMRIRRMRQIERAKSEEREIFRKRSARDFHDEAGNKITKIALMTEVAKRQTVGNRKLLDLFADIENNVQDLRQGMRDFIWVLDPVHDNLFDLLQRLKDVGNDLFEYSDIQFKTSGIREKLINIPLTSHQRRHLLMIFKEAMTNCVKYSDSENAIFEVAAKGSFVRLTFRDDGRGFDMKSKKSGHGLANMKERAGKMDAELTISSQKNQGTRINLKLKITQLGN